MPTAVVLTFAPTTACACVVLPPCGRVTAPFPAGSIIIFSLVPVVVDVMMAPAPAACPIMLIPVAADAVEASTLKIIFPSPVDVATKRALALFVLVLTPPVVESAERFTEAVVGDETYHVALAGAIVAKTLPDPLSKVKIDVGDSVAIFVPSLVRKPLPRSQIVKSVPSDIWRLFVTACNVFVPSVVVNPNGCIRALSVPAMEESFIDNVCVVLFHVKSCTPPNAELSLN